MDSKDRLNMGGSGRAFISDLKNGIVDARQEFRFFKQELQDATSIAQRFRDAMSSARPSMGGAGGGGAGGGGGYSPNQIAPDPEFTPPAALTAGGGGGGTMVPSGGGASMVPSGRGGNIVAYTPQTGGGGNEFSGGNNLTDFIRENPAAGSLFAASAVGGALYSPAEAVEAQLLMQRAAFFNSQAGGNRQVPKRLLGADIGGTFDYQRMGNLQAKMSDTGTVLDSMDSMRALVAAQSYGITGPNVAGGAMGGVAMGVAQASNLLPGIGTEGTMRAFGQMQQAKNVNLLRGIGIRLRDEQGNLKPPDQIIDDLWEKICRDYARAYGSDRKPSEREILIGLQPGNSMDSMLDRYFGNDPMAKQLVANGLLFKAKTGGGKITKENLLAMGGTTDAMRDFSARAAEGAQGLFQVSNAGAAGFSDAATVLTKLSALMNMIDRSTGILQGATRSNAFLSTLFGGGNDFMQKILMLLLGVTGKHAGGDVNEKKPYIVGEKGPELFVPESNGTIVPNHELGNTPFRHHGGLVDKGGITMSKQEWAKALLSGIGAPTTENNISSISQWMAEEGGHWGNTAGYNPLNTTLNKKGSDLMDSGPGRAAGVRHYASWKQGLDATISTLTGNAAKERGYTSIIDLLKAGDTSTKDLMTAVYKSSWGTGAGGGSGIGAKDIASFFGVDPGSLDAKTLSQINALLKDPQYSKDVKNLQQFIGGAATNSGLGGMSGLSQMASKVINYGGVVINLIAKGDIKDIAKQLKSILQDETLLENASKK